MTDDDLRRVNTRKGLIQLLENNAVDIEDVRKTLRYEPELRQLQVELVRLQRWVQSKGERIAILLEGRDAAGKGGTIRRFTEHLNPRAMRVVALPKPSNEERGQWYFQRHIRQLPNNVVRGRHNECRFVLGLSEFVRSGISPQFPNSTGARLPILAGTIERDRLLHCRTAC